LGGAPPCEAGTDYAVLEAHGKAPPPGASEEGVQAGLDAVIAAAMAKGPAERYGSSGEHVAAARDALAPEPAKTELDLMPAPAPTELDIPVPAPTEIDRPAVAPTEVDRAGKTEIDQAQ